MDIKQKILPSAHLLEIFMPLRKDENRMLAVLKRTVDIGYYRGIELGLFFEQRNRKAVRNIIEENNLNLTTFVTPYLKEKKLNLCSLDESERNTALNLTIEFVKVAAEQGVTNFGVPSGDDPGKQKRQQAKEVLAEAIGKIAEACASHDMNLTIEPLDRYAYKKQLIGPMKESIVWFEPIHESFPNAFIHWDSAHEVLGKTPLDKSLEYAKPYIAMIHLCNCITDETHPCFGDLHMDVGIEPDFVTEGFLIPEIGANIIKKVASFPKPEGVKNTYVSVEVLGHPGDDMWRKEMETRRFLQKCFELSESL